MILSLYLSLKYLELNISKYHLCHLFKKETGTSIIEYKINKQIFKIYWCLEALIYFYEFAKDEDLEKVLINCANLPEYTVREKCAKFLTKINLTPSLKELKTKLENDENYYVRNIFSNN